MKPPPRKPAPHRTPLDRARRWRRADRAQREAPLIPLACPVCNVWLGEVPVGVWCLLHETFVLGPGDSEPPAAPPTCPTCGRVRFSRRIIAIPDTGEPPAPPPECAS